MKIVIEHTSVGLTQTRPNKIGLDYMPLMCELGLWFNSLGPKLHAHAQLLRNAEVNLVAWKRDEVVSRLRSREDSCEG